ncbi:MAG: phosphatase PAP2 family protein [Methylotenera sp.]|nr:phosphatase PAP2 family protein [Methylotenera sp.]
MIFIIVEEALELALIVASTYLISGFYIRCYQPKWSKPLDKRRFTALLVLVLVVSTLKISEDVFEGETGSIDKAILIFIHGYVPSSLTGFFEALTYTGSAMVLFPLATIVAITLFYKKYRIEAMIVSASSIGGVIVIYLIKSLVSRPRPALWDTAWYWGSSFPSGHTLAVAAFATSTALCVRTIWPTWHKSALSIAMLWISLVAMSRLVLGVHWPMDVVIAACIGAFIPLVISVALDLRAT